MKTTRILGVFVVIVLLLSAIGCGGGAASGRDALYGKWQYEESGMTLTFEFKREGVLTMGAEGITFDFKFEFVDDDTIKLVDEAGMFGGEEVQMDFKVDGNNLNLTIEGETQVLTRAQ